MNNLIADDLSVNLRLNNNSWQSIRSAKKFLKHPSIHENLNSLTLKVWSNANDTLNGFFHILKMDLQTNYTRPSARQIAPHKIFSKLKSEEDFKAQGVWMSDSVGWRVYHENFQNNFHNNNNHNDIVSSNVNSNNDIIEAIVKVEVFVISKMGKVFLHYGPMAQYFGTKSHGGWHKLPNDNLYPAIFAESNYTLVSNLNVDWPYWYDDALKLNCVRVESSSKTKPIRVQTIDNIVSYMITMNEWKLNKFKHCEKGRHETRKTIWRIGIIINCGCDLYYDSFGDYAEIATNLFKNIKKLILMCIPINFFIVITTKDKIKKKLISDLFSSVFDNINEWYNIPQCDYTFWNVLNQAKITFDSSGKYFHIQTAEYVPH